jgi:hypothetical protein
MCAQQGNTSGPVMVHFTRIRYMIRLLPSLTLLLALFWSGHASASTQEPLCNPGDYVASAGVSNVAVGVATDQTIVTMLWCYEWSKGVTYTIGAWDPAAMPVNTCGMSSSTESVAMFGIAFWNSCLAGVGSTFTSPQQTVINNLLQLWLPRMVTRASETVYQLSPAGTIESAGRALPAGAHCGNAMIFTSPVGAHYYSVAGDIATSGEVLPAGTMAQCAIKFPPAAGW